MAQQHKIGKTGTKVHVHHGGEISVVLYGTEVVNVKNGTVTLKTGGWKTNTTKTRQNQAANQFGLGFSVWQNKHEWFVRTPKGETLPFEGSEISFPA